MADDEKNPKPALPPIRPIPREAREYGSAGEVHVASLTGVVPPAIRAIATEDIEAAEGRDG